MNYFDYIEQRSNEIQALLDKQKLGLYKANDNIIVSLPIDNNEGYEKVTASQLVRSVIEGEHRVELYNPSSDNSAFLYKLAQRMPYLISLALIGSELIDKGKNAALLVCIPIAIAFALTRTIAARLDKKTQTTKHEQETKLTDIMSYPAEGSIKALKERRFEGLVAERSKVIVDGIIVDLMRGRDVYHPLAKLHLGKRRSHYRHG